MRWFNTYTYKRTGERGSAASSAFNRTFMVKGNTGTPGESPRVISLPPTFRNVRKRFNASNYPDTTGPAYNEMTGSIQPQGREKAPPVSLYHRRSPTGARVRRRRFR